MSESEERTVYTIKTEWEVVSIPEQPGFSYIYEQTTGNQNKTRKGPIPDSLVPVILNDMQESRKKAWENVVNNSWWK